MQKEHLEILLESIDSKFQITLEAFQSLNQKIDTKIDELRSELRQDIAEITEVRADLAAHHRNNTELHHAPPRRPLKRA